MGYRVVFAVQVEKDLKKIDKPIVNFLISKIESTLSRDPFSVSKKLTGKFKGLYRYRIGDYRVIFSISGDTVLILKIGHRKDIYR